MLDWFYDTPIGRSVAEMKAKPINIDNINQYRKKINEKRLRARSKRKKKQKLSKK